MTVNDGLTARHETRPTEQGQKSIHLVGIGVQHSIAHAMHNLIAKSLGLSWTFCKTECPTVGDAVALARSSDTVGLVVTMPYKNKIMPYLDVLDDLATGLNACNTVYHDASGRLCGTNTDWRGVKGSLLEGMRRRSITNNSSDEKSLTSGAAQRPALVIGAGGASRAAVYALSAQLGCSTIYILNRDDQEVADLIHDVGPEGKGLPGDPAVELIHLRSVEQSESLETPFYVVGTVPDIEPRTESEITVRDCLEELLSRPEKGVVLDMCFKPRCTRTLMLAEKNGWAVVEGIHVIKYQVEEQWRFWAGEERVKKLDTDAMRRVLLKSADESTAINF